MSNTKNTALANVGVIMNSFGKVRSVDEKQKCGRDENSENANENSKFENAKSAADRKFITYKRLANHFDSKISLTKFLSSKT